MPRRYDALIIAAAPPGWPLPPSLRRPGAGCCCSRRVTASAGAAWSLDVPGLAVPVELGARVHPRPPRRELSPFLRKGRHGRRGSQRRRLYTERGKLEPTGEIFAEIRKAIKQAGVPRKDVSFLTYLQRDLRQLSVRARAFARRRVEGYDAGRPGARQRTRDRGGMGPAKTTRPLRRITGHSAVMARCWRGSRTGSIQQRLMLRLETIVRAVRWKPGAVEVEGTSAGRPFSAAAARAIITLPLGILQQSPECTGRGAVRSACSFNEAGRAARPGAKPGPEGVAAVRTAFWMRSTGGVMPTPRFFARCRRLFPRSGPRCPCARHCSPRGRADREPSDFPAGRRRQLSGRRWQSLGPSSASARASRSRLVTAWLARLAE